MRKARGKLNLLIAIRLYYATVELCNEEIAEMFQLSSVGTCVRYKRDVAARMAEKGIKAHEYGCVHTKTAFEVWGLDIEDLEKRVEKLKGLGVILGEAQ